MNLKSTLGAVLGGLGLVAMAATSASASTAAPHPAPSFGTTVAVTHMIDRPDSGGNGNWANDNFLRTATVTSLGPVLDSFCGTTSGPCFEYTAQLRDFGQFITTPGAFTPNQGASFTGRTLPHFPLRGDMSGKGGFADFYADGTPNAALVPHVVFGSNDPSSTWPQLFFGPGVTLTGLSETTFDYNYQATVTSFRTVQVIKHKLIWVQRHHRWYLTVVTYTVNVKVPVQQHQSWTDADFNNSGQSFPAGNITG